MNKIETLTKEQYLINVSIIKEELKSLGKYIRDIKNEMKTNMKNGKDAYKEQWKIPDIKSEFRHKHIVYCQMRGKTLDQIETKRKVEPNDRFLNKIREIYMKPMSK